MPLPAEVQTSQRVRELKVEVCLEEHAVCRVCDGFPRTEGCSHAWTADWEGHASTRSVAGETDHWMIACVHCAMWLLVMRSWNGNQKATDDASVFAVAAAGSNAAIQICGR